ncbi:MAG: alkaline phosphatase [Planctomycetota bacterium]|nr:alkaline phosphatase [Planctomycetota bacterium]
MRTPASSGHSRDGLDVSTGVTRRTLLGALAVSAAGLAVPARAAVRTSRSPSFPRRATNVIFMVSDGMSAGTLTLADWHAKLTRGRTSHWVSLLGAPGWRRSFQMTHAADSLVTDSAAAASAWGIGTKVNNGSVNITPDGVQPTPLLVHAAQNAKRTGIVTTTRVTHATPAGFIANVPSRDMEGEIARQIMERSVDVVMGGGGNYFPDATLAIGPTPLLVRTRDELARLDPAAASTRVLGLFAKGHVPFVCDREPTVPGLADMTSKALAILSRDPNGFVLQVEGGRVDHAAHSSDARALLHEQVEFDDAIGAVLEFVRDRDDTLVIITTDHGNANPGLTTYGPHVEKGFRSLFKVREPGGRSFDWIESQVDAIKDKGERVAKLPEIVEQATGVALDADEARLLGAVARGERVNPFREGNSWTFVLGAILADHCAVSFMSPHHTGDLVELVATGPGSDAIPAVVDNAALHRVVVDALGLAGASPVSRPGQTLAPVGR